MEPLPHPLRKCAKIGSLAIFATMSSLSDKMNDLEQKVIRQEVLIKEICDSVLEVLEGVEMPSEDLDTISNLLIGLRAQAEVSTGSICDMIQGVFKGHVLPEAPAFNGILTMDENGAIQLPECVLEILGWALGDTLRYTIMPENSILIRKNERVVL